MSGWMFLPVTLRSLSCYPSKVRVGGWAFCPMLIIHFSDVFSISGRGTVATGRVERGIIHKGDEVEIVGLGNTFKTTLTGIGMSQT